jgi:hypothetical protein
MMKLAQGSANRAFDLNDLSGPQRALLREALVTAFNRHAFDQMLQVYVVRAFWTVGLAI